MRVPVAEGDWAEQELNAFLRSHRVVDIARVFVDQGERSFWNFCLEYAEHRDGKTFGRDATGKGKVDYQEVLTPEQFRLYSRLREERKAIAAEEAVAIYMVFTNEQLAAMVQGPAQSKADLARIPGVAAARIDKYADRILAAIREAGASSDATSGRPV
jgi:superfamily II DNA helicase RecQ